MNKRILNFLCEEAKKMTTGMSDFYFKEVLIKNIHKINVKETDIEVNDFFIPDVVIRNGYPEKYKLYDHLMRKGMDLFGKENHSDEEIKTAIMYYCYSRVLEQKDLNLTHEEYIEISIKESERLGKFAAAIQQIKKDFNWDAMVNGKYKKILI